MLDFRRGSVDQTVMPQHWIAPKCPLSPLLHYFTSLFLPVSANAVNQSSSRRTSWISCSPLRRLRGAMAEVIALNGSRDTAQRSCTLAILGMIVRAVAVVSTIFWQAADLAFDGRSRGDWQL